MRILDKIARRFGYFRPMPRMKVEIDRGPPPTREQVLEMVGRALDEGDVQWMMVDTSGRDNQDLRIELVSRFRRA